MQIDNEKLLINLIEKRRIFWEPIIAASVLLMAILGVMVPLYIHSDNANRALIKETRESTEKQIEAIRLDVRDFHNRLCEIEQRRSP